MAGTFVLPVTAVKPYSGYYPCCYSCLRKLKVLGIGRYVRYLCKRCQLQYGPEEVPHRYCVALTVADHSACSDVVLFGECLNPIFGAPASSLHQSLQEMLSTGLLNPMELSFLLKTSLKSVLIGRCFTFSFRITPNEAPTQLSEILKFLPEQSLVASSIKPLGKTNQTVLAAIENQLQSTGASPTAQSQAPTSANQSISCDSSSLLYESVGAGSPLAIRLESYCEPSNVCSATGISSSHTGACLSSHTRACLSSGRLTMKSSNYKGDDACMSNDSVTGVDETQFIDSEVSEILQDLILEWESSQPPQATTRASTSVIQASSLLTDSISEQQLVSPYVWSVDFLKDFMSSFSDPPPTNPTPDCTSRKSDLVFTPSLHFDTTASCSTPELFSSTSSQKTGKTFKHTTTISPELFGSSDSTSTARQQCIQSSKFVTPATHRIHPRRNILEPIACSSHPQGVERMKRKSVSAAVAGSRSPLGAASSPELFSP